MLKVKGNFGWTDIDMSAVELGKLLEHYTQCLKSEGKSPKTISWYEEMLCVFIRYLESSGMSPVLVNFNLVNVRDFVVYEQNRELSPYTVQARVRALKAFSSWLLNEQYTEENILAKLKMPKAAATIIEPLSREEIAMTFSSIDVKTSIGMRDHTILAIFLDTGLRASELANIRMDHFSLGTGLIKVMGKGSRERIVPIGKFVQFTLLEYIERVRPGLGHTDTDYIFLSSGGKPLSVNTVKLLFQRLKRSTGISKLHAHLCRHTFAINYLMNGGDIFSLKEILGHRSLEMVNHYLHFTSHQIAIQHHKFSPMDRLRDSISTTQSPVNR